MNKYSYYLLMLLVTVIFLIPSLVITSMTTFTNFIDVIDTTSDVVESFYYRNSVYKPLKMEKYNGEEDYINCYADLYGSTNDGQDYVVMPSDDNGFSHLLVLPVSFKDSPKDNLSTRRINIHNAFFGEREKTTSYSVSEYYNISSYGNVKLVGEVAPYYECELTSNEVAALSHTKSYISRYIASLALNNYINNGGDLSKYDNNNDDLLDGIFVIYDFPYSNDNNNLYWAYVDHAPKNMRVYIGNETTEINVNKPYIASYGWASYDFMHKTPYSKVDAHVYTHEVGHLFGLLDYYSSMAYQPLGYLDMMDFNIGDHNAFSKYLLSWTSPYVIKEAGVIELLPFAESGNCLIIPSSSYTDNPFGEYLLLEFYSPTGVNTYDQGLMFSYTDNRGVAHEGHMLTNYGIKLYHVDARVGYFEKKNTNSLIGCVNDPNIDKLLDDARNDRTITSWCYRFMNTNENRNTPLIKLIEKGETEYLKSSYPATNDTLFKIGDEFKYTSTFANYKFNSGEAIPFGFIVENITPNSVKIKVIKY